MPAEEKEKKEECEGREEGEERGEREYTQREHAETSERRGARERREQKEKSERRAQKSPGPRARACPRAAQSPCIRDTATGLWALASGLGSGLCKLYRGSAGICRAAAA